MVDLTDDKSRNEFLLDLQTETEFFARAIAYIICLSFDMSEIDMYSDSMRNCLDDIGVQIATTHNAVLNLMGYTGTELGSYLKRWHSEKEKSE